jgi:hypothetical protein
VKGETAVDVDRREMESIVIRRRFGWFQRSRRAMPLERPTESSITMGFQQSQLYPSAPQTAKPTDPAINPPADMTPAASPPPRAPEAAATPIVAPVTAAPITAPAAAASIVAMVAPTFAAVLRTAAAARTGPPTTKRTIAINSRGLRSVEI